MKCENSPPHLQYPVTGPWPGPAESSKQACYSFKIHFNIIVPPLSTTSLLPSHFL